MSLVPESMSRVRPVHVRRPVRQRLHGVASEDAGPLALGRMLLAFDRDTMKQRMVCVVGGLQEKLGILLCWGCYPLVVAPAKQLSGATGPRIALGG